MKIIVAAAVIATLLTGIVSAWATSMCQTRCYMVGNQQICDTTCY